MKKLSALIFTPVACLALSSFAATTADEAESARVFAAHHVPTTFSSKPHPAMIGPNEREYRAPIRNGALYGDRFAGHYLLVTWGCGGGCTQMVAIDTTSGAVVWFPGNILHDGDGGNRLLFRADSNAIRMAGSPDGKSLADRWFLLDEKGFREIGDAPVKTAVVAGR